MTDKKIPLWALPPPVEFLGIDSSSGKAMFKTPEMDSFSVLDYSLPPEEAIDAYLKRGLVHSMSDGVAPVNFGSFNRKEPTKLGGFSYLLHTEIERNIQGLTDSGIKDEAECEYWKNTLRNIRQGARYDSRLNAYVCLIEKALILHHRKTYRWDVEIYSDKFILETFVRPESEHATLLLRSTLNSAAELDDRIGKTAIKSALTAADASLSELIATSRKRIVDPNKKIEELLRCAILVDIPPVWPEGVLGFTKVSMETPTGNKFDFTPPTEEKENRNMNHIDVAALANLVPSDYKDDLSDFLTPGVGMNEELKQALLEGEKEDRQKAVKQAALSIRNLFTTVSHAKTSMVQQIRNARQTEKNLLAGMKQIERAQEYAAETSNYLPLYALVANVGVSLTTLVALHGNELPTKVPENWEPKVKEEIIAVEVK